MDKKKLADILFLLGFLCFLVAALAITVLKPKDTWSYYENRSLAQLQRPTLSSLVDGSYTNSVEPFLQDHAAGRNLLLRVNTLVDFTLLHRPVVNQVIHTKEMLLGFNPYEIPNQTWIEQQADYMARQLAQLRDLVEGYGGHFYYVSVPGQYTYFEQEHPSFLNNRSAYTDIEIFAFVSAMQFYGVNLIEMGSYLEQIGNPPELYSTTDYHYQFGGAYLTYETILNTIEQDTGVSLPRLAGDTLSIQELPNPYLGSRARKVFGLGGIEEHLTIGLPTSPIPFTRTDNGMPSPSLVYTLPHSDTEEVAYSLYMGGDMGETVIDTDRDTLPTLLIYGDSFTNPVECLMYYSFDEMRSIDLRHYKDMTLADYIQTYQPDYVVGIRDYEALLSTDFNGRPFEIQY